MSMTYQERKKKGKEEKRKQVEKGYNSIRRIGRRDLQFFTNWREGAKPGGDENLVCAIIVRDSIVQNSSVEKGRERERKR